MGAVSEPKELPRPPQTTLVGWVVLVGSVYVALQAIDSLTGLRTLTMQEYVEDLIKAMGNPVGVTVSDGLLAVRIATVTTAVVASAMAVLGWFALRRDRGARIGLSVLAVALLFCNVLLGGFAGMMVIAGVALLWLQPSRNWFAGLPPIEIPLSGGGLSARARRDADADSAREAEWDAHYVPPAASEQAPHVQAPQGDTGARPVQGFGTPDHPATPGQSPDETPGHASAPQAPAGQFPAQPASMRPVHQPGQPFGAPPRGTSAGGTARPRALVTAAVITFVFAGLGFISSAITALAAIAGGTELMQELLDQQPLLADQGISASELSSLLALTGAVLAVFCLAGAASAGLALAGNSVGRVLLIMVTCAVVAFSVAGVLSSPVLIVPAIAAVIVLVQLNRSDVVAWFRQRSGRR